MNTRRQTSQEGEVERVIITVVGKDKVGIISGVTGLLSDNNVNILDISQTIMQDFLTMIMVTDISGMTVSLQRLQEILAEKGEEIGVRINAQHEDIFKYMHRI